MSGGFYIGDVKHPNDQGSSLPFGAGLLRDQFIGIILIDIPADRQAYQQVVDFLGLP